MVNPFTLPALGATLLAGAALGVHLGESAIGLINPIFFEGPALHPRERGVAIDEGAAAVRPPVNGQLYGWEEGRSARAADCGDCAALRARDAYAYSAEVPYFGGHPEAASANMRERATVPVGGPEEAVPPEEIVEPQAPVLRYVYYPVTAEEAGEAAAAAKADADEYHREYYRE